METPICDFARAYAESGVARFHMPGHKGTGPLGCEALDLTEIAGADSLYDAGGIIARSEAAAASLFGAAATFYSTEGSSQCIGAMLRLARLRWDGTGERPLIAAGRNAHRAFVQAAALLDFDVAWLWPEEESFSLCRCTVSPQGLRERLAALERRPVAVYVTSPDYLGGTADLAALSAEAHAWGLPLLADNAHGAYRRFLPVSAHPLDLGVDLCCDSAHKTLCALTGAAYLHVSRNAPPEFASCARRALALFGSTSPSYLILESLDLLNRALAGDYRARLAQRTEELEALRRRLASAGWRLAESDELKLTLDAAASGWTGTALARRLRRGGVECEYADPDFTVLMCTPENSREELERVAGALGENPETSPRPRPQLLPPRPAVRRTLREAALAPWETIEASRAAGRILAAPTVGCPPAVPVLVSGEEADGRAAEIFRYYGIQTVDVLR